MRKFHSLLAKGFFPRELPPPFDSRIYADVISKNIRMLQKIFQSNSIYTKLTYHDCLRVGTLRRRLGIINPFYFFKLAYEIISNWKEISHAYSLSNISLSKPVMTDEQERAFEPIIKHSELASKRASYRATSRYIIKTDIGQFYPSIYTHSIPWALHSKRTAKANRGHTLLGNRLDRLIRNCQDGQTIGIPIGPDTSLVIAEIILCIVDKEISSKINNFNGFRHVDDYEIGFKTLGEAETALATIQEVLSTYELSLNPKKTEILKLPQVIDTPWAIVLRAFPISSKSMNIGNDLISYFNKVFSLSKEYPEDSVLKYAISRTQKLSVPETDWQLFQDLLFQCIIIEPSVTRYVLKILLNNTNERKIDIDKMNLEKVLNEVILRHTQLGHASEVSWAIWLAITFGLNIYNKQAKLLAKMKDNFVALLTLHARSKKLIKSKESFSGWVKCMNADELYRENWLLAYEANIKKWLPYKGKDYVVKDKFFGYLKKYGIEFYNHKIDLRKSPEDYNVLSEDIISIIDDELF